MTDLQDPTTFDNGYFSSLSPEDKERFEDDFKDSLNEFDASAIKRSLQTEYDRDKEHLQLVKAVGACFHAKEGAATDSGFPLYGVNPLCGTQTTPADAILVNSEHNCVYLQLIHCEIGGERPGEWVENVNRTHRFFDRPETEAILREKLSINKRDIELGYATLTREDDTVDLDFSVLEARCEASPYGVWECDTDDKWIRHVDGSFLHPGLKEEFSSEIDYSRRKEPVNFGVGTHPIFPLKELLFKIIKQNVDFNAEPIDEFDRVTFVDFCGSELKVFSRRGREDDIVENEAERLLTAGMNARIITDEPSELEEREYKAIYSGARGPDHARDAVKPRYFKYMPQYEVGKKAFEKTEDEFEESTYLSDFS